MRLAKLFMLVVLAFTLAASALYSAEKAVWKPVQFAIVRFNDDAPASWNIYHGEKRGVLLVRLWKRYMLVDVKEQEVYEVDPAKAEPPGRECGVVAVRYSRSTRRHVRVESTRRRPGTTRAFPVRKKRQLSGYSDTDAAQSPASALNS